MSESTEFLYGVNCLIPNSKDLKRIDNYKRAPVDQYFRRVEVPDVFNDLDFDELGEPEFTDEMIVFINRELDRIDNGYFFYNRGKVVYITGEHYFYLNYWTLENGERPDYRAVDRLWFLFKETCMNLSYVDGIIRPKKRREGATSQEASCLVRKAIRTRMAFLGIVSKTGKDAKDVFIKMIKNGFEGMPIFLKPTNIEDPESQNQLVFRAPKERSARKIKEKRTKGSVYDGERGIGSRIDWRPTELNSYDSGRLTEALIEEGGKWPVDVPINEYWPIVRQTLRQGGRRVGFAVLPSSVNKLSKGGRGFKILYDESNQLENKYTASGLYRFFIPADQGFAPFIDKYGDSITEKPTREQAKWMREYYGADDLQCSMGAKEYILYKRSLIRDPNILNEEIRMAPLTEREAFDFDDNTNIYNVQNVQEQRQAILDVRPSLKRVRFTRGSDGKAMYLPDDDGMWWILEDPLDEEKNKIGRDVMGRNKPGNWHKYTIVADPFKNDFVTGPGSKGAGFVMKRLNPLDPENSGMPIAMFWGRPRRKKLFNEQMLLAAEYWGAYMAYESDIDDYLAYLEDEKKMWYALVKPKNVVDPNRKKKTGYGKKEFGVRAGDRFQMSMMVDLSIEYVDFHCNKIWFDMLLEQLENYDADNRTLYDLVAAFQVGCVVIADANVAKTDEMQQKKPPMVKTFRI